MTATNVEVVAHFAQKWQLSTYESLLETHILAEHSLADAISEVFKLDRLYSFDAADVEIDVLAQITFAEAQDYQCFVPNRDDDGTLQACLLNPLDERVVQFLSQRLPRFRPLVLDRRLMFRSIEEAYPLSLQLPTILGNRPRKDLSV